MSPRSRHCLLLSLLAAVAQPVTAHVAQPAAIRAAQPVMALAALPEAAGVAQLAAMRGEQATAESLTQRLAFGGLTLDQAVRMAQARYHARVVRADTERNGERVFYRLRLLSSDGRVFSVRVDAQTGEMQ